MDNSILINSESNKSESPKHLGSKGEGPKLRFPGYTYAWELRTLGDLTTWKKGSGLAKNTLNEDGEGSEVIHYADLYKFGPVITDVIHWSEVNEGIEIPKNSILFPMSDVTPYGLARTSTVISNTEIKAGGDVLIGKINDDVNSEFISYQINNKYKKILPLVTGTTVRHISAKALSTLSIMLPKIEEQLKIAQFFEKLDELVVLHQRKLTDLQAQKQGLLQKMFPKTSESVPELRFIVRGASPRPIQDKKWFDESSNIGWLRIADVTEQNGRIHKLEQHLSKAGQEKTRVLTEPHLLLSIAATVGKPVINYVDTGVHDGFLIFFNPKFNINFMFQWFEMFRSNWQKYGQPGSQVNLNSELVKNQEIRIPNLEEQNKISSFFEKIDNLITLHQRKLKHLQEQKKALLQQMFI